jgi:DNA-binding NarL/FixJ family response regulator
MISPQITFRLLRELRRLGPREPQPPPVALTDRELDVVRAAAQGLTNGEIAVHLHMSLSTVKTHLAAVHAKLGARNRVQVTAWAWRSGVVS